MKRLPGFLYIFFATLSRYTVGNFLHCLLVFLALVFALLGLRPLMVFTINIWSRILFWSMIKNVRHVGKEHIEVGKNYIYAANHSCFLDIPALMAIRPDVAWIGKASYLKVPVFGHLLKKTGYIPVSRNRLQKNRDAVNHVIEATVSDCSVAIFPEGTRSTDGEIHRFRKGLAYIVRNSNLDVVPITLNGLYTLQPKNRWWVDPNVHLEAIIHAPLKNEELRSLSDKDVLQRVYSVIAADYYLGQDRLGKR